MQNGYETITSRQNSLLVLVSKLADKKHREREGLFRFDGKKLLLEALDNDLPLFAVLLKESLAPSFLGELSSRTVLRSCRVAVLPDTLFERISEEKSPEGVIVVCRALNERHCTLDGEAAVKRIAGYGRVLFLESVRDPGNLGTIIRAARAFGTELLVLSEDCADLYHPRTLRAAMGTLFSLPVLKVRDAAAVVREVGKSRRVFAAALARDALRLGEVTPRPDDAIVVGNEGHGLSPAMLEAATSTLYIPMEAGVESLNAGIAASVLLWEFYRR